MVIDFKNNICYGSKSCWSLIVISITVRKMLSDLFHYMKYMYWCRDIRVLRDIYVYITWKTAYFFPIESMWNFLLS